MGIIVLIVIVYSPNNTKIKFDNMEITQAVLLLLAVLILDQARSAPLNITRLEQIMSLPTVDDATTAVLTSGSIVCLLSHNQPIEWILYR